MVGKILSLIAMTALLSGCSAVRDSRVNPLNWFASSREAPAAAPTTTSNALLPAQKEGRGLFQRDEQAYAGVAAARILDLTVEPTIGGAILRVTGLAARQGGYDVRLTPENEAESPIDGVLSYRLNLIYPNAATAVGPQNLRQIIAARSLTTAQMTGVRIIRVEAAENARESRRR